MKKLLTFILAITGLCFLGACTEPLLYVAGQLEPKPDTSTKRAWQNILEENNDKTLLTEKQKQKASKSICALKNLEEGKDVKVYIKNSKKFCSVTKDDKVYFYKDHLTDGSNQTDLSYLLVRDGKAISLVPIDFRYSKELGKSVPIVERLH